MTLTTDKGKTFDVDWVWHYSSNGNESIMLEYHDTRDLGQIVADFDGVSYFHSVSDLAVETDYDGYSRIKSVIRDLNVGSVQLTLVKE